MSLRAYHIHDGDPEERSVAVVARTRREALRIGFGVYDVGTACDGWISMRGSLMRQSDGSPAPVPPGVTGPGVVDFPWKGDASLARWFRDRGWCEDYGDSCCDCGLYPWDDVPESQLDPEHGEVCRECGWPEKEEA